MAEARGDIAVGAQQIGGARLGIVALDGKAFRIHETAFANEVFNVKQQETATGADAAAGALNGEAGAVAGLANQLKSAAERQVGRVAVPADDDRLQRPLPQLAAAPGQGRGHPVQALHDYRRASGIDARLVVVGMVSNGFSIADPADPGMLDVVGFDTATPQLISDFARGAL